jgi:alcohol dehydrogenase
MLGGDDLALPYPWLMRNNITVRGQWLCPREASSSLIALARAGLLDLGGFAVTEFALDEITDAIGHAAKEQARFALTVVRP